MLFKRFGSPFSTSSLISKINIGLIVECVLFQKLKDTGNYPLEEEFEKSIAN